MVLIIILAQNTPKIEIQFEKNILYYDFLS
jgi:hypothetical protein